MTVQDIDRAMRSRRLVRGLTVRQPWAAEIAAGRKRIEVRTWRTSWRGPVLIHAGRARIRREGPASGYVVAVARVEDVRRLEPDDGRALGIPGWADLWEEHAAGISAELWGWVLASVHRAVAPMVPLRGRMGLWQPTEAEMAMLSLAKVLPTRESGDHMALPMRIRARQEETT